MSKLQSQGHMQPQNPRGVASKQSCEVFNSQTDSLTVKMKHISKNWQISDLHYENYDSVNTMGNGST